MFLVAFLYPDCLCSQDSSAVWQSGCDMRLPTLLSVGIGNYKPARRVCIRCPQSFWEAYRVYTVLSWGVDKTSTR
jgi:hypothetical protein